MSTTKHITEGSSLAPELYLQGVTNGTLSMTEHSTHASKIPMDNLDELTYLHTVSSDGNTIARGFPEGELYSIDLAHTDDGWTTVHTYNINHSSLAVPMDNKIGCACALNSDGTTLYIVFGGCTYDEDDNITAHESYISTFTKVGVGASAIWEYSFKQRIYPNDIVDSNIPMTDIPSFYQGISYVDEGGTESLVIGYTMIRVGATAYQYIRGNGFTTYELQVGGDVVIQGNSEYSVGGIKDYFCRAINGVGGFYSTIDTLAVDPAATFKTRAKSVGNYLDMGDVLADAGFHGQYMQYDISLFALATRGYLTNMGVNKVTSDDYIYGIRADNSTTTANKLNLIQRDLVNDTSVEWAVQYDPTTYVGTGGSNNAWQVTFTNYTQVHVFDDSKKILIEQRGTYPTWLLLESNDASAINNSNNYDASYVTPVSTSHGIPNILLIDNSGIAICEARELPPLCLPLTPIFQDDIANDYITTNDGGEDPVALYEYASDYKSINTAPRILTIQL